MYTNEKQFTSTASEYAIEEVYTNLDVAPNDLCIPSEGYAFKYPQRWLDDPSQNKMIGVRRLSITPPRISFRFYFSYYSDTDTEIGKQYLREDVTNQNTLLEILVDMREKIYERTDSASTKALLSWDFDGSTLRLQCRRVPKDGSDDETDRYVKFNLRGVTAEDCENFLIFLNQSTSDSEALDELFSAKKTFEYKNVWDRDYIEFHASFSESRKGFLGLSNEFYYKPSLLFKCPNDGPVFHIGFYTNDGRTPILPRNCRFIIQLCFLINCKKALVM